MRVAIFDFDGTLYTQETFNVLMDNLKHHPIFKENYSAFIRSLIIPYFGAKLKVYPHNKMRTESMQAYISALDRQPKEKINSFFSKIASEMRPHFNKHIVKKVNEHYENDLHLMLVSGAFTPLLNQFNTEFNFDTIIGTNIPFLRNEVNKTERVDHIQGKRKVDKILQATRNQNIDWQNSYAYADSFSDLPVLKLVGHPIAVNPDRKLQQYAEEHKWEIIQ